MFDPMMERRRQAIATKEARLAEVKRRIKRALTRLTAIYTIAWVILAGEALIGANPLVLPVCLILAFTFPIAVGFVFWTSSQPSRHRQ